MNIIRLPLMPTLVLLTLALGACSSMGIGGQPSASAIEHLSSLVYPSQSDRGQDLDILVVRKHDSISLINRTPRVYHNVEVWLNQQYVNVVPRLEIGKDASTRLALPSFIDSHGDVYPVGGLLTPEKNQPLLMAELFDPATGLRHHLLVQHR